MLRTLLLLSLLLSLPVRAQNAHNPLPPPQGNTFEVETVYARSPRFWETVESLESRSYSLLEIHDLLKDRFNQPDEGFASLRLRFEAETTERFQRYFSRGYVALRADA